MNSEVSICNMALYNMGITRRINALSDDTQEAKVCSQFYSQVRDELLQEHPWNFAKQTDALALLTETSPLGHYVYAYPGNCLNVRRVYGTIYDEIEKKWVDPRLSWEAPMDGLYKVQRGKNGAKVVITNIPNAWCDFTYKVTDPLEFPSMWVEALAWKLAGRICVPLKGDGEGKRDHISQYFAEAKSRAIVQDANESMNLNPKGYYVDYITVRS